MPTGDAFAALHLAVEGDENAAVVAVVGFEFAGFGGIGALAAVGDASSTLSG